jgi:MFS family permease
MSASNLQWNESKAATFGKLTYYYTGKKRSSIHYSLYLLQLATCNLQLRLVFPLIVLLISANTKFSTEFIASMKFGERLLKARREEWVSHYLDYEYLKALLPDPHKVHLNSRTNTQSPDLFSECLNKEIKRIVLFVLQEQGTIASQLMEIHSEALQSGGMRQCVADHDLEEILHQNALHLLSLIQYIDLNITGIRKILKKHDKNDSHKLSAKYLSYGDRSSLLVPLLSTENDSIRTLIAILEESLTEWHSSRRRGSIQTNTAPNLSALTDMSNISTSNWLSNSMRTSNYKQSRQFSHGSLEISSENCSDYVLMQIHTARKRLHQTSDFVRYIAAGLMISDESKGETDSDVLQDALLESPSSNLSKIINLLSTFLYMTNYYIVAPSSGAYAMDLGGSVSLSGVIIGMTPVASLVSSFLYSWWTSHSYKKALVFATCCCLVGNLLYAAGLPCRSLSLVLAGRLCQGLGAARSINRRYIASTHSGGDLTAASAAFVTAGALGMAAGPALSSVLHYTSASSTSPYWQAVNAPGWVMAGIWTLFLICLIFYFEDPPLKRYLVHSNANNAADRTTDTTNNEKSPLLASNSLVNHDLDVCAIKEPPIWTNTPVMVTFWLYFVLKLVLECVLSSTATLTSFYFGWSGSLAGLYMAALGLLMLPANLGVAWMSSRYDDRDLLVVMSVCMLAGCAMILQYPSWTSSSSSTSSFLAPYSLWQYVLGSVTLFLSTNALEGPNMSLLSKTIPKSWSSGILNVGLLATEAGTLGRAVGDLYLSFCGAGGLDHLINRCFSTMLILSVSSVFFVIGSYKYLEVNDKYD